MACPRKPSAQERRKYDGPPEDILFSHVDYCFQVWSPHIVNINRGTWSKLEEVHEEDRLIATPQILGKVETVKSMLPGVKASEIYSNIYLQDLKRDCTKSWHWNLHNCDDGSNNIRCQRPQQYCYASKPVTATAWISVSQHFILRYLNKIDVGFFKSGSLPVMKSRPSLPA